MWGTRRVGPRTRLFVLLIAICFSVYALTAIWKEEHNHQKMPHKHKHHHRAPRYAELDMMRKAGNSEVNNQLLAKQDSVHKSNHRGVDLNVQGSPAEHKRLPSEQVIHEEAPSKKIKRRGIDFVDRSGTPSVLGKITLKSSVKMGSPLPDRMHGQLGLKPDGTPAWKVRDWPPGYVESEEDKRNHHEHTCFNLFKSDTISLDRELKDVRSEKCKRKVYPTDLPTTSVVFVFYNEPLSPLFRSIHSVLNRSPPHLLKEIILIDDGSDAAWLQEPLEEYLQYLPKVILKRMDKRQGLMATRTEGAREATGDVVTFLDVHIECTTGWLEPMLARIKEDPGHVVMPIIDSIDPDGFAYRAGGLDILAFSWSLGQKGLGRRRSSSEPMKSVIMAGGLFAMDRALFFELGAYDPEMKLYGGEEMEISFRIWQCGRTLECIPCSRVGHVFRTGRYWQGQVYPVPGDIIVRNKLRAAYMWMDEYATIVNNVMGNLPDGKTLGNLSWGSEIRKTCLNGGPARPFSWFMKEIYPEMTDILGIAATSSSGAIKNTEIGGCLDTMGHHASGGVIGLYSCHGAHGTQEFLLDKDGNIRVALMDFAACIMPRLHSGTNRLYPQFCHLEASKGQSGKFVYDKVAKTLSIGESCLTAMNSPAEGSHISVGMEACTKGDKFQIWEVG
eukprot:m.17652 g.17652  ORF g.17652 m.17652 type:complete len:670 (+) comp6074_c0_seq2:97-2106(+)